MTYGYIAYVLSLTVVFLRNYVRGLLRRKRRGRNKKGFSRRVSESRVNLKGSWGTFDRAGRASETSGRALEAARKASPGFRGSNRKITF